jgi:hypothetical protein
MSSTHTPSNARTMKIVYAVTERAPGKSYWTRIGVGFVNQDGSINLRLDCVPVGATTTMQVRDYDPRDAERDSDPNVTGPRGRRPSQPAEALA